MAKEMVYDVHSGCVGGIQVCLQYHEITSGFRFTLIFAALSLRIAVSDVALVFTLNAALKPIQCLENLRVMCSETV